MFWRSRTRFIPDGRCLEDQAVLQGSEAVRRLVGACRIPDPTTAGDFLRRFKTAPQVAQLSEVIDDIEEAVGIAETFSVELGHGLRVDVRCDRIFERNGKRTGLFFQRLEPEIKKILQERDKIKVIELDLAVLEHKEIMARVMSELGEQAAYRRKVKPEDRTVELDPATLASYLLFLCRHRQKALEEEMKKPADQGGIGTL